MVFVLVWFFLMYLFKPVPSFLWHVEEERGSTLTLLTPGGPAKDITLDFHKQIFVLSRTEPPAIEEAGLGRGRLRGRGVPIVLTARTELLFPLQCWTAVPSCHLSKLFCWNILSCVGLSRDTKLQLCRR